MAVLGAAESAAKAKETEDAELVRRVRRGDDRAFERLYHRYNRRICAYVQSMVHDHARAEDVTQDVFVSALRRMRETDQQIAFKPWVYEIAKNACIDQFRRSRRAEEVSYDADEGLGAADYGRLVSPDALPDRELESKTNLDHLCGAFGGLSETHHEILVMRELEGLSYREIGERLGMSRPSVESTLFRARRRLSEEYTELVSGARCQRIQGIIASAAGATLGTRDQRRLARHVSHCQPCRRQARLAGVEITAAPVGPVRQRIAALLPLPLFLRRRWTGSEDGAVAPGSPPAAGFAQWSAQLGSTVDPSWLKAAATAAAVALAGAGAGIAARDGVAVAPAGSFGDVAALLGDDDAGAGDTSRGGSSPSAAPRPLAAAHPVRPARRRAAGVEAAATATPAPAQPRGDRVDRSAPAPAPEVEGAPADAADRVVRQAGDTVRSAGDSAGGPPPAPPPSVPVTAPEVELPASVPDPAAALEQATGTAGDTVSGLVGGG